MSLAERIKAARVEAGLSQVQFAARLGIGDRTPTRWENGVTSPHHRQLRLIAEATGKPVSYFVEDDPVEVAAAGHTYVPSLLAECFRAIAEQLEARGVRVALDPTRASWDGVTERRQGEASA